MYCRPPQRRSMTIRMALIVSVVLAMLTGGCFRTTPTSTGVLDRSLDPDLWPWTVETVQVECWGDGTPGQAAFFSVRLRADGWCGAGDKRMARCAGGGASRSA